MTNDSDQSLNIVLIEDDALITRYLLDDSLPGRYQMDWVNNYPEALARLKDGQYDVALVDLRLGADSGLELIKEAQLAGVETPAILLTGQGDEVLDTQAVELGAADYLVKGLIDAASLARSLRYAVDRAHATARLTRSENYYRLMFNENPEPLCLIFPETTAVVAGNKAALELYGYDLAEMTALTLTDLEATAEQQAAYCWPSELADPLESSKSGILALHRTRAGDPLPVRVTNHEVRFEADTRQLMMVVDLRQKIRALERARHSEQALLQLLTDLRDATLVVDSDGQAHFANPAAEQLLIPPDTDLANFRLEIPDAVGDRLSEWSLTDATGRDIWVESQSSDTDWHGRPMRLISLRDITPRVKKDRQLRLMQRSIESSSNGIVIVDALAPDMPIVYVNPTFEEVTGYKAPEVIGKNCRFLQGKESDQPGVADIRQALDNAQDIRLVLKNFRKDGSPFWNDLYIAPVPDEHGQVTHFIGIQNDISAQRSAESELAYNASHDVLTGLPNRSLFNDRLEQAARIATRYHRKMAVLFLDLDNFRPINDSLGHGIGDKVLMEVARRIKDRIRPGDSVARMEADEFAVLLPDLARGEDVIGIVESILSDLAKPYLADNEKLRLTASIGVALSDGKLATPVQLIQQAEAAMHKAKDEGRNTHHWYAGELTQDANQKVILRNELQRAIETEQLVVHYQPLIDGRTGQVRGSEALVRWEHGERGLISPGDFIPIAEDTGQIIPLGRWVLEQACRDNKALHDAGYRDHVVSVNVSPLQLRQKHFLETVESALLKSGLEAEFLDLEIIESVMLQDTRELLQTLNGIKALGVGLSIDDFGTGFSSLSYIKILPATKLKIDRSFINDVIRDKCDSAITVGVISMAHHLSLNVVAEGVETEAQASFLSKNNCDLLQGFYFSKPLPFDGYQAYLTSKESPDVHVKAGSEDHSEQPTLLLLDDEENILKALARVLRRDGYRILTSSNASDAFTLLAENDVQVVLSDQRMPEISGTEFLSQVKAIYPATVRIVLSGYTDLKSVTDAINEGAIYKFLTKPWDDKEIRNHIKKAFQHYNARLRRSENQ
jgi:diguanylate cyclase (GGDEF)-like protein/PAS domain S-box-containing protein